MTMSILKPKLIKFQIKGTKGKGLGILLESQQIKRIISSYIGENEDFENEYL